MGLLIGVEQVVGINPGVYLGAGERGVAEQFLNGAQIAAPAQQVGGKRMPQSMGGG